MVELGEGLKVGFVNDEKVVDLLVVSGEGSVAGSQPSKCYLGRSRDPLYFSTFKFNCFIFTLINLVKVGT